MHRLPVHALCILTRNQGRMTSWQPASPAAVLCCAVLCCAALCQAVLEAESRHQLDSALQRTAAAATTLKEAKVSLLPCKFGPDTGHLLRQGV
jgi:hypothetical protein